MLLPHHWELTYLYLFISFDLDLSSLLCIGGHGGGHYNRVTINIVDYPSSHTYVSIPLGHITRSRISASNCADTFTFEAIVGQIYGFKALAWRIQLCRVCLCVTVHMCTRIYLFIHTISFLLPITGPDAGTRLQHTNNRHCLSETGMVASFPGLRGPISA